VYVGNPAVAERYYPAANIHPQIFEHKFAEAVRLIMALGAAQMTVRWESGWGKDVAATLRIPLSMIARGRGEIRANADRQSSLLFEAHLKPTQPELPDGLVWFGHEPTWQSVADGRLKYGLTHFELSVESTDDYGIDTGFEAKVRRQKVLSLGGAFTAHARTRWSIEGDFGSRPRRGWRPSRS
jgi:hypothetical protein